jgi:hypothetical protein
MKFTVCPVRGKLGGKSYAERRGLSIPARAVVVSGVFKFFVG